MNEELGFHDKAKFAIFPGIHSAPVGDVTIRLSVWESLDPDIQKALQAAVRDFAADMIEALAEEDRKTAEKLRSQGVELVDWSAEDRKAFRAAAVEVWDEYAKKNDLSRRAVESQKAYLKTLGALP